MGESALFRPEVMQARAGHWLGSVHLAQSVPFWSACLVAQALAGGLGLIAYGVLGTYARKALRMMVAHVVQSRRIPVAEG